MNPATAAAREADTDADRPLRVLIAKPGLDGHDRGAIVVARALRDAGMEVVYTGLRQRPREVAQAALEEDVDVVGLSSLSGAHLHTFTQVLEALAAVGLGDVPVVAGGVIPEGDIPALKEAGIAAVFGPGTPVATIVDSIERAASASLEGKS